MNKLVRGMLIFLLIVLLALNYVLLIPLNFYMGAIIYFGMIFIILTAIIGTFITKGNTETNGVEVLITPLKLGVLLIAAVFIGVIIFSPIFNGKKYRDILPEPRAVDLEKELNPYDEKKTGIIPDNEAKKIMSTQLSQKGTIGSVAQIGDITKQQIKEELWYVAPLEYRGFFSWINNKSKGTGFVMVNASTKECKVIEKNLKVQPNGYFGSDLERCLYFNNPTKLYDDFTFELDDEGNPYYTSTIYSTAVGFKGRKVTGVALVNSVTGEIKDYTINDAPKWVDRIQPLNYVEESINLKGKYINGFSPFNDRDKYKTTNGVGVVYTNGKCYYYSGITSFGKDESSLGFYLVDSRTGETFLYKKSGSIEDVAVSTAENKVKNLGYKGTFPLLVNIENNLTYFIPLLGSNDLTMSYAFVNVNDPSIVSAAQSVTQAKDEYVKYLYNKNAVSNEAGKVLTKEGNIIRINSFVQQGSSFYIFTLAGEEKNFVVSVELAKDIALLKSGDKVKFEYIDNQTKEANVKNLQILSNLNQ